MTDYTDLIRRLEEGYEQDEDDDRIITSAMIEKWYAGVTTEAADAIKELVAERDNLVSVICEHVAKRKEYYDRAEKAEADLAAAREGLRDVLAHLVAAVSVLEHGGKRGVASDKMFKVMLSDYHKSIERGRAIAAARAEGGKND